MAKCQAKLCSNEADPDITSQGYCLRCVGIWLDGNNPDTILQLQRRLDFLKSELVATIAFDTNKSLDEAREYVEDLIRDWEGQADLKTNKDGEQFDW